ncbi:VIT1/CCC1 transporter family protein [Venenivibrio stagnispumantis]|uniref:Predicted Fe2+/Mn2+ transporter, VIT1/CCC1 family n=1 Tax=Venenivibrio stagnispumantis TaxID=407998 RepID=A0AA46ADV0_9AQUI|nr:VIT1/CCC1 transporter family protein [Venenivibrio stagnispumantis]SMP09030.1 Predicted Fe2+/Mn2+ transporter, VIT1/CCC1 family [Venenivibrio stagnispumantis]
MLNDIEKAKQFYIAERNDYFLYKKIAEHTKDKNLKEKIEYISKMEEKHSNFWKYYIESRGESVPQEKINKFKLNLIIFLQKFIHPLLLISILEAGESNSVKGYYQFLQNANLNEYEKTSLKNIISDELEHEDFFRLKLEDFGMENIRDFILGMNDGLVEILGVVAGFSGVYINNPQIVGISGLIVGIAGALSMGIGAYISVKSQKEVNIANLEKNKILFDINPEKALTEFEKKLKESNVPEDIAKNVINDLKSKNINLSNLFIEEIKENEIKSGLFTGFAYLVGVIFPVIPFFIVNNSIVGFGLSLIFTIIVLSIVGTFTAIFSNISIKKKIIEMITAVFVAGSLSFGFGKLMQALFGIEV